MKIRVDYAHDDDHKAENIIIEPFDDIHSARKRAKKLSKTMESSVYVVVSGEDGDDLNQEVFSKGRLIYQETAIPDARQGQ